MYDVDQLGNKIKTDNFNVLILDTCCLLDIVRAVTREGIPTLKAAVEIIQATKPNYHIVFPSLIEKELMDNIDIVAEEARRYIKKTNDSTKTFWDAIDVLGVQKYVIPNLESYKLDDLLISVCKSLFQKGLKLNNQDLYAANVMNRVVYNIPPAKQGKNSTKDCIIYEEVLGIGRELRENAFTGKIIFSSSNTQEYNDGAISQELGHIGIQYATSLHHGLSMVK
ncbi:PIN domain-containing protein [Paenibacillus lautus]|uniref:PIN domain-containing protein n=1 Tax=Paenibacillus lautus TaxID=1401 RepID=UPI001C7D76CA|nr:PIN domain-containing protein [Paenibacillus lautus]MBX4150733.1 PIN domain-containing protein [Paenibacillus lautus]